MKTPNFILAFGVLLKRSPKKTATINLLKLVVIPRGSFCFAMRFSRFASARLRRAHARRNFLARRAIVAILNVINLDFSARPTGGAPCSLFVEEVFCMKDGITFRIPIDKIKPGYQLSQSIQDKDKSGNTVNWLLAGYVFKQNSIQIIRNRLAELEIPSIEVFEKEISEAVHALPEKLPNDLSKKLKEKSNLKEKAREMKKIIVSTTKDLFNKFSNLEYNKMYNINLLPYEEQVDELFVDKEFNNYIDVFVSYSEDNEAIIQHSINVFYYSLALCSSFEPKSRLIWKDLASCALLHDVGYYHTDPQPFWIEESPFIESDSIIRKKVENHVIFGKNRLSEHIDVKYLDIIGKHHSYLDGSGYPSLDPIHIPYLARMLSVADLFDIHQFYMLKNGDHEDKIRKYTDYATGKLSNQIVMEYYRRILSLI
jgi:HD-GYP domain-containing protein (c-di-GMP phosphodiesterase class II)